MCRGCFSQLILRDEFYSGGIAGLLGKAAGMPTRRAFMAFSVAGASALTGVGTAPALAADEGADLILRGGTIRPLPGAQLVAALAVKGGRVLAVGDESEFAGLKTNSTKIVDLDGRTVLPGLIDPHCHTIAVSLISELLDDVEAAPNIRRAKASSPISSSRRRARLRGNGSSAAISTICCRAATSRKPNSTASRPITRSLIWYINLHAWLRQRRGVQDRQDRRGCPANYRAAAISAAARTPSSTAWSMRKARCSKFAVHFLAKDHT